MRSAILLGAVILLTGCGLGTPQGSTNTPDVSSGSSASGPRITQPPVTPPTPPGTNLPDFACANAKGGTTGVADTVTARVSEQQGFDRFVLQLDSIVPTYAVTRQANSTFTSGATGQKVTLLGNTGVQISIFSATGNATFTGPTDFQHPEYQVLLEARQIQDFEGYVTWGLGLSRAACLRAFTLQDPPRLVVDFQTTSS